MITKWHETFGTAPKTLRQAHDAGVLEDDRLPAVGRHIWNHLDFYTTRDLVMVILYGSPRRYSVRPRCSQRHWSFPTHPCPSPAMLGGTMCEYHASVADTTRGS